MSNNKRIEFNFDLVSPYSALAAFRLPQLFADTDAQIEWQPFFLAGLLKSLAAEAPALNPRKAGYIMRDTVRLGEMYGLPIKPPRVFPISTLTALRAIVASPMVERQALSQKLFRAYWFEQQDISDPEVLKVLLGEELLTKSQSPAVKQALQTQGKRLMQRGAFGAPVLFWRDEMFFGQDRLEALRFFYEKAQNRC